MQSKRSVELTEVVRTGRREKVTSALSRAISRVWRLCVGYDFECWWIRGLNRMFCAVFTTTRIMLSVSSLCPISSVPNSNDIVVLSLAFCSRIIEFQR